MLHNFVTNKLYSASNVSTII